MAKRRADITDDCAPEVGKPPPEPLRIPYDGVARGARCQREVYTIMGGVTHFLGVECKHCHLEPDYTADTHNKRIANWMARELVPKLEKRSAQGHASVWCNDCHRGAAKLLGNPRDKGFAVEWMTVHLVEELDALGGKGLKCRRCHGGDLGSPQFRPKIILTELEGLPAPRPSVAEPTPVLDSGHAAPREPTPLPSGPATPLPDFGGR